MMARCDDEFHNSGAKTRTLIAIRISVNNIRDGAGAALRLPAHGDAGADVADVRGEAFGVR